MTDPQTHNAPGEPFRSARGVVIWLVSVGPNLAEDGPHLLLRLSRRAVLAELLLLESPHGRQESHRLRLTIDHGDLLLFHPPPPGRPPRGPTTFLIASTAGVIAAHPHVDRADPFKLSIASIPADRNRIIHEIATFPRSPDPPGQAIRRLVS